MGTVEELMRKTIEILKKSGCKEIEKEDDRVVLHDEEHDAVYQFTFGECVDVKKISYDEWIKEVKVV